MEDKQKQSAEKFLDWLGSNFSLVFLFIVFLIIVFVVKEIILICSILFFMFSMIFVSFARAKEDNSLNIRTNALLTRFYLKASFFLIVMSSILTLIFIIHKYFWQL